MCTNEPQFLKQIAIETAKMSYPGGMGRGENQVVRAGAKATLAEYFAEQFPIQELWHNEVSEGSFDEWHYKQVVRIAEGVIREYQGNPDNYATTISSKFLNTFMHQLMKYEKFRYLYKELHLPLDRRVLEKISNGLDKINVPKSLQELAWIYRDRPYSMKYDKYSQFQKELRTLMCEYNRLLPPDCRIKARIELNSILWI